MNTVMYLSQIIISIRILYRNICHLFWRKRERFIVTDFVVMIFIILYRLRFRHKIRGVGFKKRCCCWLSSEENLTAGLMLFNFVFQSYNHEIKSLMNHKNTTHKEDSGRYRIIYCKHWVWRRSREISQN